MTNLGCWCFFLGLIGHFRLTLGRLFPPDPNTTWQWHQNMTRFFGIIFYCGLFDNMPQNGYNTKRKPTVEVELSGLVMPFPFVDGTVKRTVA